MNLSGTSRLAQVFCESCSGVTALSGLPGPTDCTGQGFLSHWSHELASAFPQTAVSGDQATSFLSLCPDRLYRASGQLVPGVGKAGDVYPGPLRGCPGLSRGGPPWTEASTFTKRPTATHQGPAEIWKCLCFRSCFVSHPSQFIWTKLNLISKAALGLGEGQGVGVRTVSPTSSFLRSTCSASCTPPTPVTCPRALGRPVVLD